MYIRFPEWGCPDYQPISQLEMEILYHGACGLMENNSGEAAQLMIDRTVGQLRSQARSPWGITEEWICTATLIAAMQGLQGYKIPDILFDD